MFKLAMPWVLICLPLPWLIYYCLPAAKSVNKTALRIPFYAEMTHLFSAKDFKGVTLKYIWLSGLLAWVLLVFAASGPQWVGKPIQLPRSGRDIMLAIDLSGSMETPDMRLNDKPATRLMLVKSVASQFIKQRKGDRLGLILFGTRAYLQTPLTFDRGTVQAMLNDATVGLAGPQTAIGDAMGLAIKRLEKYPKDSRVLILLTDGGNNAGQVTPLAAAKIAADNHIRIYTVGLGAKRMLVPSFFGAQVINPSADLDEKTLQQIAKMTGGLYFRASSQKDLENVYHSLNEVEPVADTKATFRPIDPLYPWPLALSLLLTVMIVMRKTWQ